MTQTDNILEEKLYYDPLSVSRRTSQKRYCVQEHDKLELLLTLIEKNHYKNLVVMTKTKKGADTVKLFLSEKGINSSVMHANRSKQECEEAAKAFNAQTCEVLICTDKVFQSYELRGIKYMISYNLPLDVQDYYTRLVSMHEAGEGISFVSEEEKYISDTLQWAMKIEIPEVTEEGFTPTQKPEAKLFQKRKKPRHKKSKKSLPAEA